MKTICLSGSMKFKETIRETLSQMESAGICGVFPNLDFPIANDDLDAETIKKLCEDEFAAIDQAEALYVIDPGGYIGTLVKIEIGYALGKGKPVYLCEPANSLEIDTLVVGIIPLGKIDAFRKL